MKWLQRQDVNEARWQQWCDASPESQPFARLSYLDAVSEKLIFLLNDKETGGIALPYFERWGVKTLYMPVFCRWIDWIGEDAPDAKELTAWIQKEFRQADIYFAQDRLALKNEELVYQKVNEELFGLNTQAKRKVKTAQKNGYSIEIANTPEKGLSLVREELKDKFETLHENNFDSLDVLVFNLLKENSLHILYLKKDEQVEGVLFLVESAQTLLYLKGACRAKAKQNGGMYALMDTAIQMGYERGFVFDFGGSRIPGVRKFNQCFGGIDSTYYRYTWNRGPFWYTALKVLRNKWKKK